MLTIKDLSASKALDRAAMTTVRGGTDGIVPQVPSLSFAANSDFGIHVLGQTQGATISQVGNQGGFNGVANWQTVNGVAGQVVGS